MSGLTYHKTLTGATDVTSGLTGTQLRDRMNDNYDALIAATQGVENRLEDIAYEMFGSGVLSGMAASVGSGLSVSVAAGYALAGHVVDYAGGNVSVLANQTDANLYFAQDGNFYTAAPAGKSYFTFCTYTSNGSAVTAVGTTTKVMPLSLVTITGTFENILVSSTHTIDYEIDHSASGTFQIPGFITLSVTPSAAFTVVHVDMEEDTGSTFTARITRNEAYQDTADYYYTDENTHGAYALADLTFTRTGIGYN